MVTQSQPEPQPAIEAFSADQFIRSCGWTHPHHDAERVLSAARVAAELLRWCHHAVLIAPDRALPDADHVVDTVAALRAAAGSARQLFSHMADHVDPHSNGPRRGDAGEPAGELDELDELAGMAAAEHFRNSVLIADGLVYLLGKASDQVDRISR
jgi:hypothetical protein